MSASLDLSEHRPVSGKRLRDCFVYSRVEDVECRIGNVVILRINDTGGHSGKRGVFGSAAASGQTARPSERQMLWAFGLGRHNPRPCGNVRTMTKSFHPGRAAENGSAPRPAASPEFSQVRNRARSKKGWATRTAGP